MFIPDGLFNKRQIHELLLIYVVYIFNPPTDRETIQNLHFQKCPLVLYTHMVIPFEQCW